MKKFRADRLFDGYAFIEDNPVLVTKDDGTIESVVDASDAGDDVLQLEGILSPGFINCHCHLELSHMKGMIPPGTGLAEFVWQVVSQRHLPEEQVLAAIEKGEDEMYANGIVAVGDICNNALTIAQKLKGQIWYHNFVEASGFNPQLATERFQRSAAFFAAFAKLYSIPVESNSIVPHAPYSVAPELWERIIHFPGNHLFTMHNQETEAEDELFLKGTGEFHGLYQKMKMDTSYFEPTGKSSLQSILPYFLPNQSLILVHNVHTSNEDIVFSKKTNQRISWCLCPNANLYIADMIPPVQLLMNHDCHIVLGTDSLASNTALSILSEINCLRQHFPKIQIETMLKWATSNGAIALEIQQLVGSFEPGKKPGVLLLNEELTKVKRIV